MEREEVQKLPLGLYRVHWLDCAEPSLAAVGQTHDGTRWLAPTNWICKAPEKPKPGHWPIAHVATTDWADVYKVELIEQYR